MGKVFPFFPFLFRYDTSIAKGGRGRLGFGGGCLVFSPGLEKVHGRFFAELCSSAVLVLLLKYIIPQWRACEKALGVRQYGFGPARLPGSDS